MAEIINTFYEKLLSIQLELKAPKNQFNSFGNYNYRNAEDILNAVKPLLRKHNCLLIISDDIITNGDRYHVKAIVTLYDLESSASLSVCAYAREQEAIKGMHQSQITGSTSSYARKYGLNGMFLIDDVKDSDDLNIREEDEPEIKIKSKKKNKAEEAVEIHRAFNECKTGEELAKLWITLTKEQKIEYVGLKDKIKEKLGA